MTYPPPPGTGDQSQPPPDPAYPPVQPYQPPGYPPQAANPYATPAYPYAYPQYPPPRPTDGLAIASLAVSCVAALGLCAYGIGGSASSARSSATSPGGGSGCPVRAATAWRWPA
jgi:hypothetical protein